MLGTNLSAKLSSLVSLQTACCIRARLGNLKSILFILSAVIQTNTDSGHQRIADNCDTDNSVQCIHTVHVHIFKFACTLTLKCI